MNLNSLQSNLAKLLAACAVLALTSCGGSSGVAFTATSTNGSVNAAIVVGNVVTTVPNGPKPVAGQPGAAVALLATGDPIDVHVHSDPAIKTTVGADGSFTLRGLPEGSFTLVFTQSGAVVGTLVFQQVMANQQVTISVQLIDNEIVLLDEARRGIGDAGVEMEGLVQNVSILNAAADSRFVIAGRSVIARPGVTAIREGITRKAVDDVTVGKQVHVNGATVAGSTDVLAYQITLQNPTTTGSTATGGTTTTAAEKITICHIPPGNPGKAKTLTIDASAWAAHEAHGDKKGTCPA